MTFAGLCSIALLCALPASAFLGSAEHGQKPGEPAASQKERVERLTFVTGMPTVRKDEVDGYTGQSYLFPGRKGQKLHVDLQSTNTSLYFNVRPAESVEALYASDREETGNKAEVALPADGDYRVDVYLFRSVARRGAKASFTITMTLKD